MSKIIAVVSGGIDSVTMAYHLRAQGHELHLLGIDYGQRHRRELACARLAAERLGAPYEEADLGGARGVLRGSSLTDPALDVPVEGAGSSGAAAVPGRPNIVPNRNALLLSAAFALAVVERAEAVAFGIMAEDVGPSDTSLEFLDAFLAMERIGTRGHAHPDLDLIAPLASMLKREVIALGHRLSVPFADTWTCFRGEELHCGRCASCVERRGAFEAAGIHDPTVYAASAVTVEGA
ncbi:MULTISPECIES: 7-cyano-7-deazaguanine synthase [Streptomyces]|uniref:7-cyano-7-deazaguanine synthase n=1 Tax=Streptomyces TaxID=1883 RepID=UPI000D51378C|nr:MULTISPECIES: 7-cyano-7-deazaguanine synthase [Streptomyces]MXG27669.1 7-cyano-7-deazaguanine synthase [Streptomyces sp. YIM 132580]PVC68845.1 7-cyano-7-deazaguanine synthase [Streptomyces sp. CS065A]